MPAIIEAFNKLDLEPELLLIEGSGILHPRKLGIASHLGLALNIPTIGITQKLPIGNVEQGKVYLNRDFLGFEVKTKEHALPIYISPGNKIFLGTTLKIIKQTIVYPHKLPEPLHLASKLVRKKAKNKSDS